MPSYTPLDLEVVVSAVARNIRDTFTESEIKKIYKNPVHEKFETPCVFVDLMSHAHENEARQFGTWDFAVQLRCHPAKHSLDYTWARKITTKMLDAVNKISVSGQQVKASEYQSRISENVLFIDISYSFRVREIPIDVPDMEQLKLVYGTKAGINLVLEEGD